MERESNLFLRVMITDRIGRHEVLLQIYYRNYNFRQRKHQRTVATEVNYSPSCFGYSFSGVGCWYPYSNYSLVVYWSESYSRNSGCDWFVELSDERYPITAFSYSTLDC